MNDVEISSVILPAISGLVLFLVGMNQLIDGLKRAVGDGLKSAIQNMTRNSVKAVLTGAFITSVIQSSSITTVIAVGFITAGLLNLTQVIGIIIGANIGTTITAQMIAFDLSFLAPILLLLGFIISEFIRSEKSRHLGIVLLGLGMVFIGMEMMSHATHPLRSSQQFHDWLLQANNPLTGVLAGLIFTAIVQSSSATTGIVIVLSSQGFITLEQGISIILGSNLGTCVTALLASLGKPRIALRAASAHVIFNLLGVVLFFPFIHEFSHLCLKGTTHILALFGTTPSDPRIIANAHTLFNLVNAVLFLPLIPLFEKLIVFLIPIKVLTAFEESKPKFIDEKSIPESNIALELVRKELVRLQEQVVKYLGDAIDLVLEPRPEQLKHLRERDDIIDELHTTILSYLNKLSVREIREAEARMIQKWVTISYWVENVGDVVKHDLVDNGLFIHENKIKISPETEKYIRKLHKMVCDFGSLTISRTDSEIVPTYDEIGDEKVYFNEYLNTARQHLLDRLGTELPKRLGTFRTESNIMEALKRCHTYYRRINKSLQDK